MRAASKLAEESRTERGSSHPSGVVSQRGDHAAGIVSKHTDIERNSSKQVRYGRQVPVILGRFQDTSCYSLA